LNKIGQQDNPADRIQLRLIFIVGKAYGSSLLTFSPDRCTVLLYLNTGGNHGNTNNLYSGSGKFGYIIGSSHQNREVVIIQRRGGEDVAMITADELAGILETAHLLRSPVNATRLLTALDRVRKQSGTPQTIEDLRNEVGFE